MEDNPKDAEWVLESNLVAQRLMRSGPATKRDLKVELFGEAYGTLPETHLMVDILIAA